MIPYSSHKTSKRAVDGLRGAQRGITKSADDVLAAIRKGVLRPSVGRLVTRVVQKNKIVVALYPKHFGEEIETQKEELRQMDKVYPELLSTASSIAKEAGWYLAGDSEAMDDTKGWYMAFSFRPIYSPVATQPPDLVFHVTKTELVDTILADGLSPQVERNFAFHPSGRIYVATKKEALNVGWVLKERFKELSLLEICTTGLQNEWEKDLEFEGSWYTLQAIPSEAIRLIGKVI